MIEITGSIKEYPLCLINQLVFTDNIMTYTIVLAKTCSLFCIIRFNYYGGFKGYNPML